MSFLHLIKTVLGVIPFVILCFASAKTNLNKANRSRQFLMPIIALIYCVLGVLLLDTINDLVFKLFKWLGQYLKFLQHISWESIAIYVMNAILVLGFIFIKGIVLPIISGIWKSNKVSESTSGLFYEREEDVDKWLLKPGFANFRGYIKGFYIATFIASVVVFVLSGVLG